MNNIFWSCFPHSNAQIFPISLTHPSLQHFSLKPPQPHTKWKYKLRNNKTKRYNKNTKTAPPHTKSHRVCFVLINYSRHRVCPGVSLIYPVTLQADNWFSLWQQVSITNSFLVRCRSPCSLPPLSAGILSDWNLCRSSVYSHSLRIYTYIGLGPVVSGRHFPWPYPLPLALIIILLSFLH